MDPSLPPWKTGALIPPSSQYSHPFLTKSLDPPLWQTTSTSFSSLNCAWCRDTPFLFNTPTPCVLNPYIHPCNYTHLPLQLVSDIVALLLCHLQGLLDLLQLLMEWDPLLFVHHLSLDLLLLTGLCLLFQAGHLHNQKSMLMRRIKYHQFHNFAKTDGKDFLWSMITEL